MEWKTIAETVQPVTLVLLIVIFWLMRQNSQLIKEIFESNRSVARLTNLLETIVFEKKISDD